MKLLFRLYGMRMDAHTLGDGVVSFEFEGMTYIAPEIQPGFRGGRINLEFNRELAEQIWPSGDALPPEWFVVDITPRREPT
jgi:hypothetical protein